MPDNYFKENSELSELTADMRVRRRDEILKDLKDNDKIYAGIIENRINQSMVLRNKLTDSAAAELEKYMDLVYEQEIYELDAVYTHAFYDAVKIIKDMS